MPSLKKISVLENKSEYDNNIYEKDKILTIRNKTKLEKNKNLLYWYKKLYTQQFEGIEDIANKNILEIGSGTSPLKKYYPNVITSDVMELDYLDYCFDAHKIDSNDKILNGSLDIITLTNVLHHLNDPILFLINSQEKLKSGGKIIFTEPFFSSISNFVYKYIHHEPVDMKINTPKLPDVQGPLYSANIALPFLIFYSNQNWDKCLSNIYSFSLTNTKYYSSLSYMYTGGISRNIPIPFILYKTLYNFDNFFAKRFPNLFASFFTITLTKK